MKLIKLTYIAHGWHLGILNSELIDEPVFAWKYGPVVQSIYQDFKGYGDNQISELYLENGCYPMASEEIQPFLNKIWDEYKGFSGVELSAMTHRAGTPWDIIWNQRGGKNTKNAIIPNDLIKEHYRSKIALANGPAENAN
jgi:uncharacterized phage-associated protein